MFFPVPYLFESNPYLLGYYRLLYGFSCKAFYDQGPFKRFQRMENVGRVPMSAASFVSGLCRSLACTGGLLLDPISSVSLSIINELQVLTLGAQFRGGGNVKIGQDAIKGFLNLLKHLVAEYKPNVEKNRITFQNDSKLPITIRISSDPDVSITQKLDAEERKLVAIEIKGGKDSSNIWERIGAAEKSHLKAKERGFNERWTITQVDLTSDASWTRKARTQSATTTRFFSLDSIADPTSPEALMFRQVLGSILGVKLAP